MVDRDNSDFFHTAESPKVLRPPPSLLHPTMDPPVPLCPSVRAVPGPGSEHGNSRESRHSEEGLSLGAWLQGVGIHGMEVYFPRTAVKQSDLEKQAPEPTRAAPPLVSPGLATRSRMLTPPPPTPRRFMGQSDGKFTIGLGYVLGCVARGVHRLWCDLRSEEGLVQSSECFA